MPVETVDYQVRDGIATVTLNRPEVKNALSPVEWQQLARYIAEAQKHPEVRVMVLTGAGGTFSAGGDLSSMSERLALTKEERRVRLRADAEVILSLRQLAKPVLAMIEGAAVGAGLSLALACDVRIAAENARFGAGFHRVGLTGDFGMLWLLPRVIGPTRAMDLLLSTELIDARRAETIGLVSRVVPLQQLGQATERYARHLVSGPAIAIGLTKAGLHLSAERDLEHMLGWEADAQAICSKTHDAAEGVQAFREKRTPRFVGN